jgi:hypothetical protein
VFSVPCPGVIKEQSKDANKQSNSYREWRVELRDASLPRYEHGIEFLAVAE